MSPKTRNIIGWILAGLLTILFVGTAFTKLTAGPEMVKAAANFGLSEHLFKLIGTVELISAVLFIIPRTGILGTLLLAAYLGGAIATHLEHQQPVIFPILIQCAVWITATLRFPELSTRLMGQPALIKGSL